MTSMHIKNLQDWSIERLTALYREIANFIWTDPPADIEAHAAAVHAHIEAELRRRGCTIKSGWVEPPKDTPEAVENQRALERRAGLVVIDNTVIPSGSCCQRQQ